MALAFVPGRRDLRQVAALGAAVVIVAQMGANHWFYFYIPWFVPFALVTMFGAYRATSRARTPSSSPRPSRRCPSKSLPVS